MNYQYILEALERRWLLAWDVSNFASDPLFYTGGEGEVVVGAGKRPLMYGLL